MAGPALTLITQPQALAWAPFLPLLTQDQLDRVAAQWMSTDADDSPSSFYLHFETGAEETAQATFIAGLIESLQRAGIALHAPSAEPGGDFKLPILAGVARGWAYEIHYARDWAGVGASTMTGLVVMGARLNRAVVHTPVDVGTRRRPFGRQRSAQGRQRS